MTRKTRPAVDRFWDKVNKRGPDDCWLWLGGLAGPGYGQFYPKKHQPMGAHRFSWQLANGRQIPNGMHVLHACDIPACVNPAHLSLGTQSDNMKDCAAKGRHPHPRLVDDDEVRRLRVSGMTQIQVAHLLGVSEQTIYRSDSRTRWRVPA